MQKSIDLLGAMYSKASSRILRKDNNSMLIDVEIGVRQFCLLSPLLFNLVIDNVITDSRGIP